jgi:serine/threonine-protein kinase RsbW
LGLFLSGKARASDVNTHAPTVRLELESRPESLTLVRGALIGIGETLAFDPELLDDLKTAVSEACNNAVLHAYGGAPGPLSVLVIVGRERVEVAVHDNGGGIHGVSSAQDRMGVGLAVISALAERAEFISNPGRGTKVRMAFRGRAAAADAELSGGMSVNGEAPTAELNGSVIVRLSPPGLVDGVLGRLARGMAASARFSLDRFSDLYLLADRLAAHTRTAARGDELSFTLSADKRRLELTIGPFRDGSSAQLEADVGVLADELQIESEDGSETLRLVVCDRRGDDGDRS